jgi:mono/diheme cytochrome c family protein
MRGYVVSCAGLLAASGCMMVVGSGCQSGPLNGYGGFVSTGEGLDATTSTPDAVRPEFGTTVTLANAPPAISGGTLLLTQSGSVVASDPDRDQIYVIDLATEKLVATIPLTAGDEPGRLVEDGDHQVHVALRRGGAVVTVDLATNAIVDRRPVCAAPRGITWDVTTDNLYVACNGGELVTLPAAGGAATRTLHLVTDLRDVVVNGGNLYVSRLRQAEVIEVDSDGSVTALGKAPVSQAGMIPDIAWRTIAAPSPSDPGGNLLAMVHQRAKPTPVSTNQGGYGQSSSGCPGTSIIEATITTFDGTTAGSASLPIPAAVLPVDLAVSPDATTFAVVAAGNAKIPSLPGVFFLKRSKEGNLVGNDGCAVSMSGAPVPGQATAVVFARDGVAWVQTREPAALVKVTDAHDDLEATTSIPLSSLSREDTGHSIVHSNSGAFIACASCHAEGGDDGRVWEFSSDDGTTPARRTQSMRGTLEGTAPYHWEGDMKDISTLAHEVFVKRMDGLPLTDSQSAALQAWLFTVPRPSASPASDPASVARGAALFQSTTVGCSGCHSGPHFTNNKTLDVGTGGQFQVPSLIGVGWRAPYFHDGRAPQLIDRFNPGLSGLGGDPHGNTSGLSTSDVDDLVAYLQTL